MEKVRMPGVSVSGFREADFARIPQYSIAFSSEVGTGSRQENTSNKGWSCTLISSKPELRKREPCFTFLQRDVSRFHGPKDGDGAKVEADTILLFG
jgi:hypothetical protein